MSGSEIELAMNRHVDRLMAIPGVVGVAVGELDDRTPAILVLVAKLSEELAMRLPREIESHPVKVVESGEFEPFGS